MTAGWWSAGGLISDFAGVVLLGVDLVRLQNRVRTQARNSRAVLDGLASDYGGTESWAEEIKKSAVWHPESSYSEYHAEDEVSFNTRNAIERLSEIAECTNGLASHLSKVTTFLDEDAAENEKTAGTSFWFSVVGLVFIAIGFTLQLVGSWPKL